MSESLQITAQVVKITDGP